MNPKIITKQFFDQHYVKVTIGVIVLCFLFVVYSTIYAMGIVNSIDTLKTLGEGNKTRITALEKKSAENDINMVEIKTKLANIESTLSEIKQKLK